MMSTTNDLFWGGQADGCMYVCIYIYIYIYKEGGT